MGDLLFHRFVLNTYLLQMFLMRDIPDFKIIVLATLSKMGYFGVSEVELKIDYQFKKNILLPCWVRISCVHAQGLLISFSQRHCGDQSIRAHRYCGVPRGTMVSSTYLKLIFLAF